MAGVRGMAGNDQFSSAQRQTSSTVARDSSAGTA